MKVTNIEPIIEKIRNTVNSHCIDKGQYSRWIWQNEEGNRDLGINEYGCADAANILYTIGDFPCESSEREKWITTMQNMQNPKTGMFNEATHQTLHTTAHCIAALELFDAKPKYEITKKYKSVEALYNLLDNLDWKNHPWTESHNGAGIYVIMNLTDNADEKWNDAYFEWLWNESDENTGLFGKSAIANRGVKYFEYMAGTFHYLFNLEYARMPLKYPEKLIDICLWMYKNIDNGELGEDFLNKIAFIQVDWVYCITRALRQCGHRYAECISVLEDFAEKYIDYLMNIDEQTVDDFNDLHLLFGCVCCIAELQQTLKGKIKTKKPLRLVLDRRPFI